MICRPRRRTYPNYRTSVVRTFHSEHFKIYQGRQLRRTSNLPSSYVEVESSKHRYQSRGAAHFFNGQSVIYSTYPPGIVDAESWHYGSLHSFPFLSFPHVTKPYTTSAYGSDLETTGPPTQASATRNQLSISRTHRYPVVRIMSDCQVSMRTTIKLQIKPSKAPKRTKRPIPSPLSWIPKLLIQTSKTPHQMTNR